MIIHSIEINAPTGTRQTLSAIVTFESPSPRSFRVYFRVEGAPHPLVPAADPFVIGFLAPAMLLGEPLRILGPVDPGLLASIRDDVIPLLRNWFPFLHDCELDAPQAAPPAPRVVQPGCALAFSGGVDAFHTAIRYRNRVDWLVTSRGFDTRTFYGGFWREALAHIRAAADVLSLPLIVVTTNLREISHFQAIRTRRGRIHPGYYNLGVNGPIGNYLAAVGRSLAPFCSRFLISSSISYDALFPFGSHPLLEPMWSTAEQKVELPGCEARRLEKVAFIAREFPRALERLRVCWLPGKGEVNCSRCEKCLRTMAEIRCAGAQAHALTFHWPLDLGAVRHVKLDHVHRFLWKQIREAALLREDRELGRAIDRLLGPSFLAERLLNSLLGERRMRRAARREWQEVQRKMRPPDTHTDKVETPPEVLAMIRGAGREPHSPPAATTKAP